MATITLVGAGSVVFAKTLIGDVLQTPCVSDSEIRLMDIDPARLKVAEEMVRRMIATLRVKARVVATLDRKEAIRGADYVISSILVGGHRPGAVTDFEIPKKYGLRATIGDTIGVGGVFRGLRTIPEILKIARDIADVGAPRCLFLNYTNPMAMACWAVNRAVGIPCVGMCHSIQGTARQLTTYTGLDEETVSYRVAGINHMAFFLDFRARGQDAYPLLFKLLDDPSFRADRVRFEMMRRTGYFVTESSEHQAEYTPYFLPHGEEHLRRFDVELEGLIRRNEAILASWERMEKEYVGSGQSLQVKPRSQEYASYIIESQTTNKPCVIYGNVPNRGLIPNLPQGCVVEVPSLVDAGGFQSTVVSDFPEILAAICRTNINVQALTVEAALTGRREAIYHAAMLDPSAAATLSLDQIWSLCDELIEAHQGHGLLGKFAPSVRGTGRSARGICDRAIARLLPVGRVQGAPGSVVTLELSVEPGPDFAETDQPLDFSLASSVPLEVEGGTTVCASVAELLRAPRRLTARLPEGFRDQGRVELHCAHPSVLCLDATLRERRRLDVRNNACAEFEMELAGFPAADIKLSAEDGLLRLQAEIRDSRVNPSPRTPWNGSGLEVFFATASSPNPRQYCLIPDPQAGALRCIAVSGMKSLPLPRARFVSGPLYYSVDILLPREIVDLRQGEVLFDLIVDIDSLGDAHSGGRSALNNRFDSNVASEHFALLQAE